MEDAISALEGCAFRAWPAETVTELHGWRLRFMRGVTRRANSVWPNQLTDELPVKERISAAQRLYAEQGLPTRFQLGPRALPGRLDAALEELGYSIEAPVSIQVAEAAAIPVRVPSGARVVIQRAPSGSWLEVAVRRSRFRDVADVYLALLERVGSRALYATVELDGVPAAAGLGVLDFEDPSRLGIFSMVTLAEHRGRGLGRAVVGGFGQAARDRGVTQLYLQVERDNAPALALYGGCGFSELYGYHYRRRAVGAEAT